MGDKDSILVIEDNDLDRELVCEILGKDYKIYCATNGKEGLEVLQKHRNSISVILLDIQMPIMNGMEFMDIVLKDDALKAIPIIILSADEEGEDECLAKGALDYIRKPFSRKRLQTRVHNTTALMDAVKMVAQLEIDSLTGLGSRKTFFDRIEELEEESDYKDSSLGIAFIDINGLKRINDSLGHAAGDEHIKSIADKIGAVFGYKNSFRLGGDEFAVISLAETEDTFNKRIEELNGLWTEVVSASVGTVWLDKPENLEAGVYRADKLMYEDKNRFYRERVSNRRKARAGQNEDAILSAIRFAEYVPAGFFGYYAEGEEEIIFANREVCRLYGCETEEEFRQYVGNSFRGMVHPEDLEAVESGITEQISKDKDTDYIEYRIISRDGEEKKVVDYGRFIHTESYGNIFLVMLADITS